MCCLHCRVIYRNIDKYSMHTIHIPTSCLSVQPCVLTKFTPPPRYSRLIEMKKGTAFYQQHCCLSEHGLSGGCGCQHCLEKEKKNAVDCANRGAVDGRPCICFNHRTLLWQLYCANSRDSAKQRRCYFVILIIFPLNTLRNNNNILELTKKYICVCESVHCVRCLTYVFLNY